MTSQLSKPTLKDAISEFFGLFELWRANHPPSYTDYYVDDNKLATFYTVNVEPSKSEIIASLEAASARGGEALKAKTEHAYEAGIDEGRKEGKAAVVEALALVRAKVEDRRQHWKWVGADHDEDSGAHHEALVHEMEAQDIISIIDAAKAKEER